MTESGPDDGIRGLTLGTTKRDQKFLVDNTYFVDIWQCIPRKTLYKIRELIYGSSF